MSWLYPGDTVATTSTGIKVENCREKVPEWRRSYSGKLDARANVEIDAYTMLGSRMFSGSLTQPNGNSVWFDPARIADKILDPTLVPLVAKFCDEMFALDRAYVKSKPNEFVDQHGTRWAASR